MKLTLLLFATIILSSSFGATKNNYWSPENALSIKPISAVALSPDGNRIAYVICHLTKKKWLSQLWLRNKPGKTHLLVKKQQPIISPTWSPDGSKLAYLNKGKKHKSIWIINIKNTKIYKLIELNTDIVAFKWSPNGRFIAFIANDVHKKTLLINVSATKPNFRIYLVPITYKTAKISTIKPITPVDISVPPNKNFDWASDGKSIVYSYQSHAGFHIPDQSKLAIIELKTKHIKKILYSATHASRQPLFSPDGKWIAFRSLLPPTKVPTILNTVFKDNHICISNINTQKTHCLANTFNENPTLIGWSKSSSAVFVWDWYKTDGPQIYKLKITSKTPAKKLSNTNGYINPATITINTKNNTFGFAYETVTTPPEIYIGATDNLELKQISHIQNPPNIPLGTTKKIQWKSKDGKIIEGLLITPPFYQKNRRYPLLVAIHGGPNNNWVKRYLGGLESYDQSFLPICWENIVSQGFIVLLPNPRGSSYGRAFRQANFADLGGGDYQDIMSGIDYLIKQGIADPNHLAIYGWSYGGYMTAWTITQTHRFKAAIDESGITDLISFAGTSDISRLLEGYLGQPFWINDKLYLERSPIMHVKNITTPLLILHGDNDNRIPITQSYELYNALKAQNKPVKMLLLPKQGHALTDPNVILETMKQINVWLQQAL